MRDAAVNSQLDHLRVDHDELDLVRARLIQQAQDQRVHAHRFARAGRTGDEHVRELGDIADDTVAADVLADGKGELGLGRLETLRLQDRAQIDRADDLVRHLDADGGDLLGDRRDAHVDHAERQRQIAREIGHARELDALLELEIVTRDRGAADHADDGGVDAEAADRVLQALAVERDLIPGVRASAQALVEQLERRENVLVRRVGVGLDRLCGVFLSFFFCRLLASGFFLFRRIGDLGGDGDARADLDGRGRLAVRAVLRPVVADVAADERGLFRRGSVVARPGITCCLAAHLGARGPGREALIGQIVELTDREGFAFFSDRDILAGVCTDLRRGRRRDLWVRDALRAHDAPLRRGLFLYGELFLLIIRRVIGHARAFLYPAERGGDIIIDRLDREDDEQNDEQRKRDRVGKADLSEQDADHAENAAVHPVDPLPIQLSEVIHRAGIVRRRIPVGHAGDIGEHDRQEQCGDKTEGNRSSAMEDQDP